MKATQIATLLPAIFREALVNDPTLVTLLDVMESLLRPVEERLTTLWTIFNTLATDERFTPMLARWVDLMWLFGDDVDDDAGAVEPDSIATAGIPPGRLRELIGASHELAQERGTAKGLAHFLEVATGVKGFRVEDLNVDAPFHLRVHVPPAAAAQAALIGRIVNAEKPAHATWEPVAA